MVECMYVSCHEKVTPSWIVDDDDINLLECPIPALGWVGYLRGSCGLSARRARRTKSRTEGPATRSRGPEGP